MARMIPLYSASSQTDIARRARELFEQSGCPAGSDLDHWLQAEEEHLQRLRLQYDNPIVAQAPPYG